MRDLGLLSAQMRKHRGHGESSDSEDGSFTHVVFCFSMLSVGMLGLLRTQKQLPVYAPLSGFDLFNVQLSEVTPCCTYACFFVKLITREGHIGKLILQVFRKQIYYFKIKHQPLFKFLILYFNISGLLGSIQHNQDY